MKKYRISERVDEILNGFDTYTNGLFRYYLIEYMEKGISPKLETVELRDLWFYLKVHELAEQIQYEGYNFYGTFPHIELRSELAKNGSKISNPYFHIGRTKCKN